MNFKHGKINTPEYGIWARMRARCNNPKSPDYINYGGRGIKVHPSWESFTQFLSDMGERPSPKHTLDRADNDGDYSPLNCRWATRTQQNRNTRRNLKATIKGKERLLLQWCEDFDVSYMTVYQRIYKLGWAAEKALTTKAEPFKTLVNGSK